MDDVFFAAEAAHVSGTNGMLVVIPDSSLHGWLDSTLSYYR